MHLQQDLLYPVPHRANVDIVDPEVLENPNKIYKNCEVCQREAGKPR